MTANPAASIIKKERLFEDINMLIWTRDHGLKSVRYKKFIKLFNSFSKKVKRHFGETTFVAHVMSFPPEDSGDVFGQTTRYEDLSCITKEEYRRSRRIHIKLISQMNESDHAQFIVSETDITYKVNPSDVGQEIRKELLQLEC